MIAAAPTPPQPAGREEVEALIEEARALVLKSRSHPGANNLESNQGQLDENGVMVAVSRQAAVEAIAILDEVEAMLERVTEAFALALLKPEREEGWRPIESAPRDGTRIDLWSVELGRVPNAGWASFEREGQVPLPEAWRSPDEDDVLFYDAGTVTHWRPLPAPPEREEG